MSRVVTPDAVPITVVTVRTGEIWVYPGHIKIEVLKPLVCAERGLAPDTHLAIWLDTFNSKDPAEAAKELAKKASQIREVTFK